MTLATSLTPPPPLAWFNGKAGMYGKSWGGFNGLQQAYKEADSSPLKTAISLYSTDNR